jgi:hypothetical protein
MGSTCEFHPLDSYRGYILYRARHDDGTERYLAFRTNDYEPLVRATTLEVLKECLDVIENVGIRTEEEKT